MAVLSLFVGIFQKHAWLQLVTFFDSKHCAAKRLSNTSLLRRATTPIQGAIYTTTTIFRPSDPSYTPSSMVTLRHQGFSPFSANISSASPTCRLSETSLLTCPLSLSRMAFSARKLLAPFAPLRASPRDGDPDPERISSLETQPPSLVTGSCYWRGSDDEERRLRWR